MAKIVTIGYGDREGYDRTAPSVREAAHAHDAQLMEKGMLMGMAGKPVQVRNHDAAGAETTDGPYMVSALPIAGFAIIEAANIAEAMKTVTTSPSTNTGNFAAGFSAKKSRGRSPSGCCPNPDHA